MSNPFSITHGAVIHTNDPLWTLPMDGKGAVNGSVKVYINGKLFEFDVDADDKYVIDFNQPLPEGKHVVEIMTFDQAGNPSPPGVSCWMSIIRRQLSLKSCVPLMIAALNLIT